MKIIVGQVKENGIHEKIFCKNLPKLSTQILMIFNDILVLSLFHTFKPRETK